MLTLKQLKHVLEDGSPPINNAGGTIAGLDNNPPVGRRFNPKMFAILRRRKAKASALEGKSSVGGTG